MFNLIFISILVTFVVVFIIWLFSICVFGKDFENYTTLGLTVTMVISVIVSFTLVFTINNINIARFIHSWSTNKAIYESSSDITRILTDVEEITEKNRQLLDYQSDQKHWYGFYIPESIQDLELIRLTEE